MDVLSYFEWRDHGAQARKAGLGDLTGLSERARPTTQVDLTDPLKMRVFGRPVTKGVDDARGVTLVYRKLVRRMELEGETNFKFVLHRQTTMTMLDGVVHERHPSVTVVCMSAFEPNSLRDLLRGMVGVDTNLSSLSSASPVTPRPQTFSQSTFSSSNDGAISHPRK